jgi:RimJ/RimL family protein N-acetyltransferase
VTEIETGRLLLRRFRPEDAEPLAESFADPEVMRYIGDGSTGGVEDTRAWLRRSEERWEESGWGHLAVERAADGRILGRVGFLVWNRATWDKGVLAELGDLAEVELGWILAREHWGSGYATEAAAACRDWAFGARGRRRLISIIQPANLRSISVAERLGEHFEEEIVTAGGQAAHVFAVER